MKVRILRNSFVNDGKGNRKAVGPEKDTKTGNLKFPVVDLSKATAMALIHAHKAEAVNAKDAEGVGL